MKKATLILLMLVTFGLNNVQANHHTVKPVVRYVYICVSKTAHKYHSSQDCRGLSHCTHTIEKVTMKQAIKMGYTACKLCE